MAPNPWHNVSRLFWRFLRMVGISQKTVAKVIGRNRFSRDQASLLDLMRRDNEVAGFPFTATEHWRRLNRQFEDWFYWEGIGDLEQQTYNQLFSSPRPGHPKLLRYACWLLYQHLKMHDHFDILSEVSATVNPLSGLAFEFSGKLISWDLLISVDTLYSISEVDDSILTQPVIVVDLGAGWGRIGYVLKSVNPNLVYVICDLPETLMISSTYLPRVLPCETFCTYLQNREIREFTREVLFEGGTRFLGPQDLERFSDKSIDFLINVASFQEMTPSQVDAYFNVIDRKVKGIFYTQQLWSGQTHKLHLGEISGFKDYPFRPTWQCHYVRNVTWSDLYFEACFSIPRSA
jgi:putative sugar O-methyltransferase